MSCLCLAPAGSLSTDGGVIAAINGHATIYKRVVILYRTRSNATAVVIVKENLIKKNK